jgi:hypothetical protein
MTTGPLGGPYEARSGYDTQQVALLRQQGSSLPHKVVTVSAVICSNPIYIRHEDACFPSRYEPWLMLHLRRLMHAVQSKHYPSMGHIHIAGG